MDGGARLGGSTGDLVPVAGKKLSAAPISAGKTLSAKKNFEQIEVGRRAAGIPQGILAHAAGLSERTYRNMLAGRSPARPERIARLDRALDRLVAETPGSVAALDLVRGTFAGFVGYLAPHFGVTASEVFAIRPQDGRTADLHWRACARVRQAATYLTNVEHGLEQRRLAEALDLTPAAVCLAIRAVEGRRDDPTFDALLSAAALVIKGTKA